MTSDELGEQLGPARFGLRHADVDAEQVTLVVGADAVRDERGHVLDAARPPCVDEGRVEVQVRERLGDALPAQLVDPVLEPLGTRLTVDLPMRRARTRSRLIRDNAVTSTSRSSASRAARCRGTFTTVSGSARS